MDDQIYLKMVTMEQNHWWYKGRREIIGKLLLPFLTRQSNILDAGCGAGGTMEYMSKYGSVVGVDISQEMVEHCRNIGLAAYCESIDNLPFENQSFDLVLCLDVLEHLPNEQSALKELIRVVRPGGILTFSVPAFSWLWGKHDDLNNHYRRYNRGELIKLIEMFDLTIERITYFNLFLLPPIWFIRKMSKQSFQKRTDFEFGTGIINQILLSVLRIEKSLLKVVNIPIGVSQIVVVRKK
ncbi:class I SAM-dependent methyltransferase [Desulfotomaculum defluvii]